MEFLGPMLQFWLLKNTSTENLLAVGNTRSRILIAMLSSGAQRF